MGSIYLIRHGQASFGADNYDVLSERGVRQAQVLGAHWRELGLRLDRCYSGSLSRQQSTGKAALEQLHAAGLPAPELQIDPAFNEFHSDDVIKAYMPDLLAYEPEAPYILANAAQNRAEFQRLFAFVINRWSSGQHPKQGLQSWAEFVQQVEDGIRRILASADNKERIAIFTSGGTISAAMQLVMGLKPASAFELNWQIVNTSQSLLKFRGNDLAVASFNSHVHLELLKNPELITFR